MGDLDTATTDPRPDLVERLRELEESEQRFRGLFEEAPRGLALVAPDGRWLRVNRVLCEFLGYSQEELLERDFQSVTHPDDVEPNLAHIRQLLAGEVRSYQMEKRYIRKDGQIVWAMLSASLVRDSTGRPLNFVSHIEDISPAKAAEARLRSMFEQAPIGKALVALDGRIEEANPAMAALCGHAPDRVVGVRLSDLIHPHDLAATSLELDALVTGGTDRLDIELRFLRRDGATVDVLMHATLLSGATTDGRDRMLCQVLDISDRKRSEARLRFMADHDALTGLLNRRRFEDELTRHVAEVNRYGAAGAVIVLDIDHFKQVNDTLGHRAGDRLIVETGELLRNRLRASDVIGRLGGDEFAVLLPQATCADAERVADALVREIRTAPLTRADTAPPVTISLGVAMVDSDEPTVSAEAVLIAADLAMYDAKQSGRDRYALAFHGSETPAAE